MKQVLVEHCVENGMTFDIYRPQFDSEAEKIEQQTRIVNNLEYILKSFDKKE